MHFWGAIVDGGCYQPGCLDSFITTRRVPRLLLTREGFERRLGPPVRVETYRLADAECIELCFYRMPRPVSLWRRIFRLGERGSRTEKVVPVVFRNGSLAGGRRLHERLIKGSGVTLVSSESAPSTDDSSGRGGVTGT